MKKKTYFCSMIEKKTRQEAMRFVVVGVIAVLLHYGIYWVLQHWINVNVAFTIGYFLSFLVNYYLSARYTFRSRVSARSGAGFSGAHLVNYLLQITLLNLFLYVGVSSTLAPIGVYSIAVPVNFLLVRFVFRHA